MRNGENKPLSGRRGLAEDHGKYSDCHTVIATIPIMFSPNNTDISANI
jgi:hypothetical protein